MADIAQTVLDKLKIKARETGKSYQLLLQLFCQEEFLRRLERSRYRENLVLKGGLFLYSVSGFKGRPTMDIDFLLRDTPNSQENIMTMIGDISDTVTENDFVRFEIKGLVPIAEEREYNGMRVKMITYIKQTRTPFELDMGVGDVVIPKAEPRKLLTQLDGFMEPEVLTYSLESTIAEKFDAIITRMEFSSRMKDYYDIYFLATTFHFEARKLQVAILATLQKRKTIYGEDAVERVRAFEQNADMQQKWKRFTTATIKISLEFGAVVEIIDKFIGPIFMGVVFGQEVAGVWNPATVRYE